MSKVSPYVELVSLLTRYPDISTGIVLVAFRKYPHAVPGATVSYQLLVSFKEATTHMFVARQLSIVCGS
tara:strand:- start:1655 stop:1861 length:207 start_codon:yes stop_codon:yes gene_type:complete